MRKERPILKDFDLPTQHLIGEHYVPPMARSVEEIERRRRLPRGLVLAEHAFVGTSFAYLLLKHMHETGNDNPEDRQFAKRLLGTSAINSAWFDFAQHGEFALEPVQRRRTKLPRLDAGRPEWRPSSTELFGNGMDLFNEATAFAGKVSLAVEYASPRVGNFRTNLGRTAAKAGLTLAVVPLGDKFVGASVPDADVSVSVRQQASALLEESRSARHDIGVNPSLAAFTHADSAQSVYFRNHASNAVLEAYEFAYAGAVEPYVQAHR